MGNTPALLFWSWNIWPEEPSPTGFPSRITTWAQGSVGAPQNTQAREATNNPSDALLSPCRGFGLLQNGYYRRLQLRNGLWPVRAVRPGVKGKTRHCREENHPEDQAHLAQTPNDLSGLKNRPVNEFCQGRDHSWVLVLDSLFNKTAA